MGSFFNVYFKLNESLSSEIEINPKYYVSNNRFFQRNHKDLINSSILIKEWELYDLGINENYDTSNFKRICRYQ